MPAPTHPLHGEYTSAELISELGLAVHPEGGYFVVTDEQEKEIPSPYADNKSRLLATSIYYLLTYDNPRGFLHMNKSVTYHILHEGRAEYTLITPGAPGQPPTIKTKVMGTNIAAGETRMLLVGTGVWKMSRIPQEDMNAAVADATGKVKEKTHCLITEVVVPGFHWEDHRYLKEDELVRLFEGVADREERKRMIEAFRQSLRDLVEKKD